MSIVAISETTCSAGIEVGRTLASSLGYDFADREIITKAAEAFGEGVVELTHVIEEKPTLWERLRQSQHRYVAYIEAIVLELAARDNVVLVGRASTLILRGVPHALRVRIDAPESLRVERVEERHGLTRPAALDHVRQVDHDLATRVRFLYHVDWDDSLLYDLVLNTERLGVARAARLIREALEDSRFEPTVASRRALTDRSIVAQARAALLAGPATRARTIEVACVDGAVSLSGSVRTEVERQAAGDAVARIPGVVAVQNAIVVGAPEDGGEDPDEVSHGQFRHGEERSWGGYGGGWYERDRQERGSREDRS